MLNLLRFTRDKQAGYLHTSTSEVYGDPDVHPQTEEYWLRRTVEYCRKVLAGASQADCLARSV